MNLKKVMVKFYDSRIYYVFNILKIKKMIFKDSHIVVKVFIPDPPRCRDVRGTVWFGFEHKSHPNRNIKMHAVRFGSVDF
jgi:hypothetical protein